MPVATANGLDLYYEMHGEGHPLVLIAGFTCDNTFWEGILGKLAKHFQVLIFDNRGVGRSSCPDLPYTVDDMALDAIALIESLQLKKPHILGHSLGGCVAQTIAYRKFEISKLVLANTLIQFDAMSAFVQRSLLHLRQEGVADRPLIEATIPWLFSRDFFNNPTRVKQFIDWDLVQPGPSTIGFTRQLNALVAFDSKGWFDQIRAQTLVIHGEEDMLLPTEIP